MNFLRLFAAGKSMVGMKDQNCPYRMRTQNLLPKFEAAKTPFATTTKVEAGKFEVSRHSKVSVPVVVPAPASVTPVAPVKVEPVKVLPAIMETRPLFGPDLQPAAVPAVAPVIVPEIVKPVAPVVAIPISVVAEKTEISEAVEIKITQVEVAAPAPKVAVRAESGNPFAEMVDGMDAKNENKTEKITTAKPAVLGGLLKKLNPLGYLPKPSRNQPKLARTAVQTELSLERIKVMRNDLHDSDLEIVAPKPAGKPAAPPSRLQTLAKTEAAALGRMTAKFFGAEETQVH